MFRRLSFLERYGVGLFGSYLLLFLAMHTPLRHAGVGILARQPANYLTIAKTINPLSLLNAHLGWLGGKAARFEELSIYIMLFLLYILAVRKMRQSPLGTCRRSIIITGIALFSLPLFALPFIPDQDIYSYIIYGRMAAAHGANPATTVPSDFPQEPFFQFLGVWRSLPCVYGPLWMRFSEGLTLFLPSTSAALWLYLLAYKLAAVIFHIMAAGAGRAARLAKSRTNDDYLYMHDSIHLPSHTFDPIGDQPFDFSARHRLPAVSTLA